MKIKFGFLMAGLLLIAIPVLASHNAGEQTQSEPASPGNLSKGEKQRLANYYKLVERQRELGGKIADEMRRDLRDIESLSNAADEGDEGGE